MKMFSNAFWNRFDEDYVLVGWLFLRGLALLYFAAFASLSVQIEGLVGSDGILPLVDRLALVERAIPQQKFWLMPTVFWLDASDTMLKGVCYAGMVAATVLFFGWFVRTSLMVCYVLYCSLVAAGQEFTQFQWDAFLLESGFLALFLTWGSGIVVLLYRWLLARFMFMGGVVKLASGDPSWANLTALSFHYETQPLPTPMAYYAYHLPDWFHQICVGGVFVIELLVPFFIFLTRPFRLVACGAFLLLQGSIVLTGNYNFFNLLTMWLCLFLLEDRDFEKWLPQRWIESIKSRRPQPGTMANGCAGLWGVVVLSTCLTQIWLYHVKGPLVEPFKTLLRTTGALSLVNNYGPFAIMTTKRDEIIVQGSADGRHWRDYSFKYKPGKLNRPLGWNISHQPRLDWQMWFAALENPQLGSWFDRFLQQLLKGSLPVLSLLESNPFPDRPPTYVRALLYRYSFTSLQERRLTGDVWQRQFVQIYWPAHRLKSSLLHR